MKKLFLYLLIILNILLLFSCKKVDNNPTTDQTPTTNDPITKPTYSPSPVNFMYHEISDDMFSTEEGLFVSPKSFEEQVKYLVDNNIPTKFTSEVLTTNGVFAVLTFDDGYKGLYTDAFPIIQKYNIKITVFLITDKIETLHHLSTKEIMEMSESGLVEFASHTSSHPFLSKLSKSEIQAEITNANTVIEAITGKPVKTIAYPYGDYNESVIEVVKEFGYNLAYTTLEHLPGENLFEQPRYTVWRDTPMKNFVKFLSNPTPIYK